MADVGGSYGTTQTESEPSNGEPSSNTPERVAEFFKEFARLRSQGYNFEVRISTGGMAYNQSSLNDEALTLIITEEPPTATYVTRDFNKELIDTVISSFDNLWKESWLECRKLAFLILGWISPNPTCDVSGRLREWCEICGYDRVMDTAFAVALAELWRKSPELMISVLESWMTSSSPTKKLWGMRVVQELSNDILVSYLPTIFQLLTPYIQSMVIPPDTDLILAIKNLAEQNPQETAFFLRRIITTSENDGVYALIRQSLDSFSSPTKQELKNFLYQKREESGDQ